MAGPKFTQLGRISPKSSSQRAYRNLRGYELVRGIFRRFQEP